jgi:hypothetical protein
VAKEIPVACSLDAEGLSVRGGEIHALGPLFRGRSVDGDAVVLRFDPAAREAVADLTRRELDCCPFFDFDLTEADGEVRLRVSAPPEAAPVLEGFVGAFGA